ncbi:MAG: glycosyltransferase family 39 protein [Candidatus Gastranaerophilaceae bacterium]
MLNKIFEKYKNNTDFYNIAFLMLIILFGFIFCKGHYGNFLTDFGREMIFPEAIAKGKVLYKDILCIYFPLAYQINAVGFKIFGTNLAVLEIFGLINSLIFSTTIYLIGKEFLSRKISLLYSITTAIAISFNGSLFNFILPYSSSMSYGVTAYLLTTLFVLKYLKESNMKFLHTAFLAAGFAFACKGEYGILFIVLLFTSVIIKPCSIKENILNTCLFFVIPIISLGTLFVQGLSISDFMTAMLFMKKFFTTDSMLYHISRTGSIFRIENFALYTRCIIGLSIFLGTSFLLFKAASKNKILYLIFAILAAYIANKTNISLHTAVLPLIVSIYLLANLKKIYSDKDIFLLVIFALALNIRTYWSLILTLYGMYTAPLLLLAVITLIFRYSKDNIKNENLKNFVVFITAIYLIFFIWFSVYQKNNNNTLVQGERGSVYLPEKQAKMLSYANSYIQTYTKPNDKILILPEGTAINFLLNRPVDLKMHMADRLYYDAIGGDKVLENIKNADYELIIVIKGYGLTNFGKPYLYNENNDIIKYLEEKYKLDWETKFIEKNIENTLKCYVKPY